MLLNYRKFLSLNILMASKNLFFKATPLPRTCLLNSRTYSKLIFCKNPLKPTSNLSPFLLKTCGVSYTPHARTYSPGNFLETYKVVIFMVFLYECICNLFGGGGVVVVVDVCFSWFCSGSGE